MKYKYIIKFAILLSIALTGTTAGAQEYKYEIGGMAGTSMYMGDGNQTNAFLGLEPAGGLVLRRNFNFRWAAKTDLYYGKVSGDTRKFDNVFPNNAHVAFNRNFVSIGGQMEFNFMPYSDKFKYLNTSRLSPYLLAGFGITVAPGEDNTFAGLRFPFGLGLKYKIMNRVNIGLEYTMNRLFGDSFDAPDKSTFNLDNPYYTKSKMMKNQDWYNTLMFSVTWDFGPNDRKCTNL
ncbi:MAG: porin family protein [Dysgonamonadaceae bacterium]|nr:porin family protein [Dysgonamonadaceae bacterium]